MVGSKCRDLKNREVSNVNVPLVKVYVGVLLLQGIIDDCSFILICTNYKLLQVKKSLSISCCVDDKSSIMSI